MNAMVSEKKKKTKFPGVLRFLALHCTAKSLNEMVFVSIVSKLKNYIG